MAWPPLSTLCDYLIVSMHWGAEYQHSPSKTQKAQARLLCQLGADLIIGTHPHVLQPMEWLESEEGHQTLCVYSLGNLISNQQRGATMLGGILEVELEFEPGAADMEVGEAAFTVAARIIPTVTHFGGGEYRVYPLEDYTEELAASHGIKASKQPSFGLEYLGDLAQQVLGDALVFGEAR